MIGGCDSGGGGSGRWKTVLLISLLGLALSACSGTTPDAHEQAESQEESKNRWNAEDSDLPGEPIAGKKARIKEGIHIRPGIEFAELTVRESKENIEFTDDKKTAYVTGSAREEVEGKEYKDVLMGDGFIYQLERPPVTTKRGLKVELQEFSLISIVWGDFELNYPEDFTASGEQQDNQEAVPPYREDVYRDKTQKLALPWVKLVLGKIPWAKVTSSVTMSGSVNLGLEAPDVTGVFKGRIPIVAESYDCDSPSRVKAGCLWGHCAVNKKYCVEEVEVSASMDIEPEASMTASVGGSKSASYPSNKDLKEIIPTRDLGEVTIPSSPISVGVEFLAGYKSLLKLAASIDVTFEMNADATVTVGARYTDDAGIEPIADLQVDDAHGDISLGASAQLLLRHAVESGLRWTVQPTGTGSIGNIEFELETVRTTLELRWDSIYSYNPVSQATANKSGNGVPKAVAGSCVRTKLVLSPLIVPEFAIDMGLSIGGYGIGKKFNLIDTTDSGGDALVWRPYQWSLASLDGGGQYCLSQQECENQNRSDCDDTIDPPDPPGSTENAFKVEASWLNDTDVDLEVKTPDGVHFGPGHTQEAGSAEYPFDVCGGTIPCTDDDHRNAEAVVYLPAEDAPDGTYKLRVTNDNGRRPADVELKLRTRGIVFDAANVDLSASPGDSSGWISLTKK